MRLFDRYFPSLRSCRICVHNNIRDNMQLGMSACMFPVSEVMCVTCFQVVDKRAWLPVCLTSVHTAV